MQASADRSKVIVRQVRSHDVCSCAGRRRAPPQCQVRSFLEICKSRGRGLSENASSGGSRTRTNPILSEQQVDLLKQEIEKDPRKCFDLHPVGCRWRILGSTRPICRGCVISVVSAESSQSELTATTTSHEKCFNHPWDFGRTQWAVLLSRKQSIRMT